MEIKNSGVLSEGTTKQAVKSFTALLKKYSNFKCVVGIINDTQNSQFERKKTGYNVYYKCGKHFFNLVFENEEFGQIVKNKIVEIVSPYNQKLNKEFEEEMKEIEEKK